MSGLCKVSIIGNLGRDPEKRYTAKGTAVTGFSVAATTRRRGPSGEFEDKTEWFNVTLFGQTGERLAEVLGKGHRVYVSGRLEVRIWQPETTQSKGFSLEIFADEVVILDADRNIRQSTVVGNTARAVGRGATPQGRPVSRPNPAQRRFEDPDDLESLPFWSCKSFAKIQRIRPTGLSPTTPRPFAWRCHTEGCGDGLKGPRWLARKWGIDGKTLLRTVDALPEDLTVELARAVDRFWDIPRRWPPSLTTACRSPSPPWCGAQTRRRRSTC
jgi:single-strand DNA-binding protein